MRLNLISLLLVLLVQTGFMHAQIQLVSSYQAVNLDSLIKSNSLQLIQLKDMHVCGGSVTGYFKDSTLLIIDATYSGEDGYSSHKVYWIDSNNMRIIYQTHFPDYGKHQKETEIDGDKLAYEDVIYDFTYNNNSVTHISKTWNGKTSIIDPRIEFFDRIKRCCIQMSFSLIREKKLSLH